MCSYPPAVGTHAEDDYVIWAGRPTKHIIGHIGDGILWVKLPNQQCQSTEGSSGPNDQA